MKHSFIKYLGHSCVLISINHFNIVIDPFLDSNPSSDYTIKDIKKLDLILLTHGHFDHIADAIALSQSTLAPMVCVPELAFLLKKMNANHLLEINIGGIITAPKIPWIPKEISIKMVGATHSSSVEYQGIFHYAGLAGGFIISTPLGSIYHMGDTALTQEFKSLQDKVDILLPPIDGHYNMGIQDTQIAIEWIRPKIVIPIHYNTFPTIQADPSLLQNPYGKIIILNNQYNILEI